MSAASKKKYFEDIAGFVKVHSLFLLLSHLSISLSLYLFEEKRTMVKFESLNTDAGLAKLNKYLENYSYVDGYEPSQEDVSSFFSVGWEPDVKKYPHANRWYKHIQSFSDSERALFASSESATKEEESTPTPTPAPAPAAEKNEEELDLFGDDDEDDEWSKEVEKRAAAALEAQLAAGKTKPVAKSKVVLDVKPNDDETDLKALEDWTRSITQEGLTWQSSQLVEVAYGIKKLQIQAVIVDDLVSMDDIQERIQENEDLVQSTDIISFQKL